MIEKEKAIRILKTLIEKDGAVLSTKYSKSHEKVAVIYNCHTIEILGGEEKFIKYFDIKIPLSKKEYKELYSMFMEEVSKRKEASDLKKFNELQDDINK